MKKLSLLLAFLLLLTGCSNTPDAQPNSTENDQIVAFDVYAVNDLHGKLADTADQPGVDELSTYLKNAERTNPTILLSTGDMWQGASESNLTGGLMVTEWMNRLGFDAMVMGGHEYDWGEEQIEKNRDLAAFPFLAINIFNRDTDEQVDYCQNSVVVEVEGAQIGIIGAIGNVYNSIASENTEKVYFKTGDDLTALVKAESEKLRREGVDFIIYAIHDGHNKNTASVQSVSDDELQDYYDVSLSGGYVDLVFEADTHYTYTLKDKYGVYHLQAGGNNSGISRASVQIDLSAGTTYVYGAATLAASQYSYMEDDPVVEELLEKYDQEIAPSTKILGANGRYRNKDAVCQLVADLYCAAGVEKWGETYDIVLAGGYMSCRSPGYLAVGEVSYGQLTSLLPFDNTITLCSIQGRDLISRFLENDHEAYYITTTAYGDSVRDNIDPDALYYVVTDNYSSGYAYNRMTVIDTYADNVFARDLVADHIAAGGLQTE